jgi:hypothetical protein
MVTALTESAPKVERHNTTIIHLSIFPAYLTNAEYPHQNMLH